MLRVIRDIEVKNMKAVKSYLAPASEKDFQEKLDALFQNIPEGFEPDVLSGFYKKTGLKLQVEYHRDCDITIFDRIGRYPREDAVLWNRDFCENVSKHPEWLVPQEDPDIVEKIYVDGEF